MSETAEKEWNVGDTVWIAMRNPEARTDYVVYSGVVENKWTPEKHPDKTYFCVRTSSGKSVWWVSCLYATEREAIRYAIDQSLEIVEEWEEVLKRLTLRLIALALAKSNNTQTPVQ